jgi:hypothetical protein
MLRESKIQNPKLVLLALAKPLPAQKPCPWHCVAVRVRVGEASACAEAFACAKASACAEVSKIQNPKSKIQNPKSKIHVHLYQLRICRSLHDLSCSRRTTSTSPSHPIPRLHRHSTPNQRQYPPSSRLCRNGMGRSWL